MTINNSDYWRLRDFEYAQPLYDLAFLIEIDALRKAGKKPKYRAFALWKAALGLDSYGTQVDQWLDGQLADQDLDQIPSNRIETYLREIRAGGSIPELATLLENDAYHRCLRLRSLRGLGPVQIAEMVGADELSDEWLEQTALRCNISTDKLLACFEGKWFGTWQPAHILPPLLRLLNSAEQTHKTPLRWELPDVSDPFRSIASEPRVVCDQADLSHLRRVFRRVVKKHPLFKMDQRCRGFLRIRHSMGWSVRLDAAGNNQNAATAGELARRYDPLTDNSLGQFQADLHLHTSWSDGAATLTSMARAASQMGLAYIAVTDHSRSCKLQGGLTPVEWFRQSISLMKLETAIPVLHGIEVDILPEGQLDLPGGLLSYADFVVASVHSNWTDSTETNTRRVISAVESGRVDVLGHPTSAVIGKPGVPNYQRPPAQLDWEKVFSCCAKWKVAVEFNCFPSRLDLPLQLLQKALDCGCWLAMGSDAHSRAHLTHLKFGQRAAKTLNSARVLNYLPRNELKAWLEDSRAMRQTLIPSSCRCRQACLFEDNLHPRNKSIKTRLNPSLNVPGGSPIVGIDLTSGNKLTGVAFLERNRVETCSLNSDEDLLRFICNKKPALVSIDSPLGLPGGGNEIDPNAGIMRVAEYDLNSIGIPAYPALIDSMQDLTLRGIRLRKQIESMDNAPTVIESYPGAAQDLLNLPRKQNGLELLRDGLRELGLSGPGIQTTSHDEVDAITSALVGRFFESGNFVAMGIPSEAQLIVPTRPLFSFDKPPVICLSGKTAAGKSVVARYLATFCGFQWCKTRDLVRDLLLEDSLKNPKEQLFHLPATRQVTEKDLQEFGGLLLLHPNVQEQLRAKLAEMVKCSNTAMIVDSVRDLSDIEELRSKGHHVTLWFIEVPESTLRNRLRDRVRENPTKTASGSPVDKNSKFLRNEADIIIQNAGTLAELRWEIDDKLCSLIDLSRQM